MSARVRDEVLAARVVAGDELAFTVLAARYQRLICSLCWSTPAGLEADDLRQEALLGLLEACRACSASRSRQFVPAAVSTIRWRVLSARERAARVKDRALNEAVALDACCIELPAHENADPAVAFEVRERLGACVRELPEAVELACQDAAQHGHAPVVVGRALRIICEGGSIATAATAVGVSEAVVYRWVRRLPAARDARRSLRRRGNAKRARAQRAERLAA